MTTTPNTTSAGPEARRARVWHSLGRSVRELSVFPGLVVLAIVGAVVSPIFFQGTNISLIFQQSSELGVIVVGLVFIVLTGRIDISLESTVGFAPMVAALLMVSQGGWGSHLPGWAGILITLGIGALIGLINGLLVVKLGLDSFIVSLAMLILLRGVTTGLSQGQTLASLPESYTFLGSESVFGIPLDIVVTVVLFVAAGLFLKFHSWGRALYAIGGNENAAHAAGVPVDRVLITAFVAASTLAALAGMLLAGRLSAVTADAGQNMIFSALAATVIGGIALIGGQGRILGAALGVLLLGVLTNVLTLAGVSTFWIDAVYGAVIVLALLVGRFTGSRRS
ncbi:ABC transporter permease [Leifsonia poae]|uniref:ABC transporter permease n=1 Tax=Leifsonia poae TaxID=110933 RepID=UPI001CBC9A84|nr:ABC transporter permease [Leifsonia poae]